MRIVVVCSSTRVFGAEVMSLNLMRGFRKAGHEVVAVTSSWTDGEFGRRLQRIGVEEVALPLGTFSKKISLKPIWWSLNAFVRLPEVWFGISRLMRRFQPDILLLTNPKQSLLISPWLNRCSSFQLEHSDKASSWANLWLYQQLSRKLTRYIATSQTMVSHLQSLRVRQEQVRLIYMGAITMSELSEVEARQKEDPIWMGIPRVGIAGQISAHKGHEILLEALRLLHGKGLKLQVIVFGGGNPEYVAELNKAIAAAGLGDCWSWAGYKNNPAEMFRAMDICVMPSCFDEPFGMVAVEAAAFGLPVIASRRGGLPEIVIDGVTGFLVDSGSAEDLAVKLECLLANPQIGVEMGQAGRSRVKELFTIERMVSDFEKLFLETNSCRK